MSNVQFGKWNLAAFESMRRDPIVQGRIGDAARAIAAAAGDGYEVGTMQGKSRARASVITATNKAMKDNIANNTLLRSIGAAR